MRAAIPIGIRMRASALAGWRRGQPPTRHIGQITDERFVPLLAEAQLVAHLRGRYRTMLAAAAAAWRMERKRPRLQAEPFSGAVRFLSDRLQLDDDQLGALRHQYGDVATDVTRGLGAAVEAKVAEAVRAGVEAGDIVTTGTRRIRRAFDAAGVAVDDALLKRQPHLFETLFRTQVQLAYAAGRAAAAKDPDIDELLWGWEYSTVGDDRVRPTHAAMHRMRLPKDDPRWAQLTPPNGFNCRCTLIEVWLDETDQFPAKEPPPETPDGDFVVPDPGFDFNPGDVYADVGAQAALVPRIVPPAPVTPPVIDATTLPLREALKTFEPEADRLKVQMASIAGPIDDQLAKLNTQSDEISDQFGQINTKFWAAQKKTRQYVESLPQSQQQAAMPLFFERGRVTKQQAVAAGLPKGVADRFVKLNDQERLFRGQLDELSEKSSKVQGKLAALRSSRRERLHAALRVDGHSTWSEDMSSTIAKDRRRRDRIVEGSRFAQSITKSDALAQAQVKTVKVAGNRSSRSHYSYDRRRVEMSKGSDAGTAAHEVGHWIEHHDLHVFERAQEWLNDRTQGKPLVWLGKLTGNKSFRRDELARDGGFTSPYVGKNYVHQGRVYATEVISMGIESLFRDALKFAAQDPDHFRFTLAVLRGAI